MATRRRGSLHPPFVSRREGNAKGKMKIGMALTRRRQPRKAVGTQILCKRTRARARARERTFLLIFDLGRVSRAELSHDHVHTHTRSRPTRASVCIYVRGNWLSTLPGATTVRRVLPDSSECGLRIVIALYPIPFRSIGGSPRVPRLTHSLPPPPSRYFSILPVLLDSPFLSLSLTPLGDRLARL